MARPRKDNGDNTTEDVPDFGDRPELGDGVSPSTETLSHNWQEGSPGVDMRDASAPLSGNTNLATMIATQEANAGVEVTDPGKDTIKVTQAEYDRRTKLDVSDPAYINPSLDHHTVA